MATLDRSALVQHIVLESFGFANFFGVFLEDMLQSISQNVPNFVAKFASSLRSSNGI